MKFKQKYLLDGILVLAVIGVILVSGCAKEEVTCNPPYIKVGTSCCLDQNNNSICDEDKAERNQSSATGKIIEKGPPQPEKTVPSCTDECSSKWTKCVGYEYYECGDYDDDSCLEWSSGETTVGKCNVECKLDLDCGSGEECKDYKCVLVKTTATVSEVIDGDTIDLQSGERVRLLGINTPERGQPYYEEATNRLGELVEGKKVTLEKDVDDKDQYGRLLRYVFLNDRNINVKLVREGLATLYINEPNLKYEDELKEAWNECLNKEINLCKPPEPGECDNTCIGISYFRWNAEGNDCDNLNGEYVKFENTCPDSCNLTGWTVKDESSRDPYVFPTFSLKNKSTVTLYTGCGNNTGTKLYWCSSGHICNAVWNNDGDTLYLRNSNSELVLSYSYP